MTSPCPEGEHHFKAMSPRISQKEAERAGVALPDFNRCSVCEWYRGDVLTLVLEGLHR